MPRGMFDNRPQSEVDQEDRMIAAIKNRAINGTEGPADVARINAGSAWLSGGMSANVKGAEIAQQGATEQSKLSASMAELQRKAESDQQLADTHETGATGREQMTQTGQTLRQDSVNRTGLATNAADNANRLTNTGLVNKGALDVTGLQGKNQIGAISEQNKGAANVANIQGDYGLQKTAETVRGVLGRASLESDAKVKAAQLTSNAAEQAALIRFAQGKEVAISNQMMFLDAAAQKQLLDSVTSPAAMSQELQRIRAAAGGTAGPTAGAPSPLKRNPAGI